MFQIFKRLLTSGSGRQPDTMGRWTDSSPAWRSRREEGRTLNLPHRGSKSRGTDSEQREHRNTATGITGAQYQNPDRQRELAGGPVVRTPCFHCWGLGSIPGERTKILQAAWHGQKGGNKIQKLYRSNNQFLQKLNCEEKKGRGELTDLKMKT